EQVGVRYLAIGQHLLLVLVLDFRMHLPRQRFRTFAGADPHRALRGEIDKGRRHFSPVTEFERPLAQPAAGHDGNRIGGAAVNLHKGNETLAIFAARVVDAQQFQPKHGQPDAQHLAGTEMSVGFLSVAQQFVKALQWKPVLRLKVDLNQGSSESSSATSSTKRPLTVTLSLSPTLGRKVTRAG